MYKKFKKKTRDELLECYKRGRRYYELYPQEKLTPTYEYFEQVIIRPLDYILRQELSPEDTVVQKALSLFGGYVVYHG